MKTICKLAAIALLFLAIACNSEEDNNLLPNAEIPEWLEQKISADKSIINTDPMRMQNYGAWVRYEFNKEYYYEYDNPLSSVAGIFYSEEGNLINATMPSYKDYPDDKCCGLYLWKAPNYSEIK